MLAEGATQPGMLATELDVCSLRTMRPDSLLGERVEPGLHVDVANAHMLRATRRLVLQFGAHSLCAWPLLQSQRVRRDDHAVR